VSGKIWNAGQGNEGWADPGGFGHTGQRHGPVGAKALETRLKPQYRLAGCGIRVIIDTGCGITKLLMVGCGIKILRRDAGCGMKDRKSYVTDVTQ